MFRDMSSAPYVEFALPRPSNAWHWKSFVAAFALGAALSFFATQSKANVVQLWASQTSSPGDAILASKDASTDVKVPYKLSIDAPTPTTLQLARGTCWLFGAVDVLESSYRQQGIANGWLEPKQYVRMSEQALGVSVIEGCAALPKDQSCRVGEEVWRGSHLVPISTEGGYAEMLFFLKSLSKSGALPWSVCPYTSKTGQDRVCPGLDAALKTNPLTFDIKSFSTYHERHSIRRALSSARRLLAFATQMITIPYRLPCTEQTSAVLQCDPHDEDSCWPCPADPAFVGVSCCAHVDRESNTMDGEFFRLPTRVQPEPELEGGHVMGLVGFSDVFRTRQGYVGGYIVKNSWWDGLPPSELGGGWVHARGSHTIDYFLQKVATRDEAQSCPNAHAPRSWYACSSLLECRSRATAAFAAADKRPLHLTCIDRSSDTLKGFCRVGEPLFLESLFEWGAGLTVGCFLRDRGDSAESAGRDAVVKLPVHDKYRKHRGSLDRGFGRRQLEQLAIDSRAEDRRRADSRVEGARDGSDDRPVEHDDDILCSPPVPVDDLALTVAPIDAERYTNDPDLCGHYFFPYELAEEIQATFGDFQVSDVDVRWPASAYAANAATHTGLDYSGISNSTFKQRRLHYSSLLMSTPS